MYQRTPTPKLSRPTFPNVKIPTPKRSVLPKPVSYGVKMSTPNYVNTMKYKSIMGRPGSKYN